MLTVMMWFFLACGLFQVGSALLLHAGLRVPAFLQQRTAFGQLCQGAAGLFMAQACAATEGHAVTWTLALLAPLLLLVGLRADQRARGGKPARSA